MKITKKISLPVDNCNLSVISRHDMLKASTKNIYSIVINFFKVINKNIIRA